MLRPFLPAQPVAWVSAKKRAEAPARLPVLTKRPPSAAAPAGECACARVTRARGNNPRRAAHKHGNKHCLKDKQCRPNYAQAEGGEGA